MRRVSENENDPHRYDDLLDLEHHTSGTHRRMDNAHRAAQFIPFSALSGFEEKLEEEKREVTQRHVLSESEKEVLDERLQYLQKHEETVCTVTCFVSDPNRDGGSYIKKSGTIRRIDLQKRTISFADRTVLPLDLIDEIELAQ